MSQEVLLSMEEEGQDKLAQPSTLGLEGVGVWSLGLGEALQDKLFIRRDMLLAPASSDT